MNSNNSNKEDEFKEHILLSDLILMLLANKNDKIEGRTVLQKLVYLTSINVNNMLINKPNFKPHYYGPYSYDVALTLDQLVNLGFVEEYTKKASDGIVTYIYSLTEDGKKLVNKYSNKKINKTLCEMIDKLDKNTNNNELIQLAKIHYIITNIKRTNDNNEIIKIAEMLDWELNPSIIDNMKRILKELKLIDNDEGK